MKQTITETEEKKIIVTTCDNCNNEIGRSGRGDYSGYRCSVCGRQYCYSCFEQIMKKDKDEMKSICPTCDAVALGALQKMKGYQKEHQKAIDAKIKTEERWAARSKAMETIHTEVKP